MYHIIFFVNSFISIYKYLYKYVLYMCTYKLLVLFDAVSYYIVQGDFELTR